MVYLKPLLLRKDLPIPWGSILFGLNCLIITFPLLLDFNQMKTYLLPNPDHLDLLEFVKYISCQFGHGGQNLPSWQHLITNLMNLAIIGVIIERAIGTARFIIMCFLSSFFVTIFEIAISTVGFGSSGMLYSFWIFLVIILYKEWNMEGRKVLKSPLFLFLTIMSIWAWTITILLYINPQATDLPSIFGFTNTVHLIGTLTGVLGFVVWKKPFIRNLQLIQNLKFDEFKPPKVNFKLTIITFIGFSIFTVFNLVLAGTALFQIVI